MARCEIRYDEARQVECVYEADQHIQMEEVDGMVVRIDVWDLSMHFDDAFMAK